MAKTMKKWIKIGAFFAIVLICTSPAAARTFQIPIEVSTPVGDTPGTEASKAYNRLILGVHPEATDGYDLRWETPAFFSTPDPEAVLPLKAYIDHREYGSDQRHLWRDIRAEEGEQKWNVMIALAPSQMGKTVTVAWDLPPVLLASRDRVTLSDPDNAAAIDMRTQNTYAFIGSSTSPKALQVTVSGASNKSQGSGSGSWGCGSIRSEGGGPTGSDPGSALVTLLILLSPLWLRLRRKEYDRDSPELRGCP